MDVKSIPLLFLVFMLLAIAALVYVLVYGAAERSEEMPEAEKQCDEGKSGPCMKGPCEGTRSCTNGTWGACIVQKTCEPGEVVPCAKNGCASAYKVCNGCGTGYGECIGLNET